MSIVYALQEHFFLFLEVWLLFLFVWFLNRALHIERNSKRASVFIPGALFSQIDVSWCLSTSIDFS